MGLNNCFLVGSSEVKVSLWKLVTSAKYITFELTIKVMKRDEKKIQKIFI